MIWNRAFTWGWVAILVILFLYEMYAMIWGKHVDPMLTQVTVKYVPWWVTLPFIGWLFTHFALRYFNSAYVKDLGTTHPFHGWI